ncbi:MAG: ABC transporter permease [Gammaproteobacteria bacterium]|nr:MAG: ABC transporter permease [Gammaproteobacteria bacterium]
MRGIYREWRNYYLILLGLTGLLILSLLISLGFGSVYLELDTIWRIVWYKLTGIQVGEWSLASERIVWMIRAPRIIFTVLVGAGLAVVGAVMQAVVRNRMADPYLLGLTSGASTGASVVILLGLSALLGEWALSMGAFLGALLAFFMVFLFSRANGRMTAGNLILAGIAISYLFSSITGLLTYMAKEHELREVTVWLLGSVAGGKWNNILLPSIVVPAGFVYLFFQSRKLNAISMGEETSVSLGLDSSRFRKQIFLVTSAMVGVLVALSGSIGFVGLMIPHFIRLFIGNDHKKLLPLCLVAGGLFLVWADVIARTILSPMELPIGIITSMCGAPFFIWLLQKKGGSL